MAEERRYYDEIASLQRHFPEFDVLTKKLFSDRIRFECIDVPTDGQTARRGYRPPWRPNYEAFRQWIFNNVRRDVEVTRWLMIEDYSPTFCISLGAMLDLDPRFFVEHLNRQIPRFATQDRLSANKSSTSTGFREKPFVSLRWLRPVRHFSPATPQLRKRVEQAQAKRVSSNIEYIDGHQRQWWTLGLTRSRHNILRSELAITATVKSSVIPEDICAIEERVTIYPIRRDGLDFGKLALRGQKYTLISSLVVFLADAVPTASHWTFESNESPFSVVQLPPGVSMNTEVTELYSSIAPRPISNAVKRFWPMTEAVRESIEVRIASTVEGLLANLEASPGSLADPSVQPLFQILSFVQSDTRFLLEFIMDLATDVMQSSSSPEAKFEDLLARRLLLSRIQGEVQQLKQGLERTFSDLDRMFDLRYTPYGTRRLKKISMDGFHTVFQNTSEKLKEASMSLIGTMQFIESHRAILEAEGVTRLTELAFLFIPLSFSASLFSMQIQEFSKPVPVWAFLAFALSLSAFTYLLRLLARSSWIHHLKVAVNTAVRENSDITYGGPIPNAAYLTWAFARSGPIVLSIAVLLGILAPPLAVLWTRPSLPVKIKIPMTIVLIIFIGVVLVVGMLLAKPFRKRLRSGFEMRWSRRVRRQADDALAGDLITEENKRKKEPLMVKIARWLFPAQNRRRPPDAQGQQEEARRT